MLKLRLLLAVLFIVSIHLLALAGEDSSSNEDKGILFRIERSRDPNEVWYAVNLNAEGELMDSKPVNVYWSKDQHTKKEALSWLQKHFAYGLKITEHNSNCATFHFVSYAKRSFTVEKTTGDQFCVFTKVDGKQILVKRICVNFGGGTFLAPIIDSVELHGVETISGSAYTEILKP